MAMFNSTNERSGSPSRQEASTLANPESGLTCIIAKGTLIEGKITSTENMRIDGTVKGEVKCDKRLVMDAEGKVEGDVFAHTSSIKGQVIGTVTIKDTLHLLDSCFIKGTIRAKQMKVEEGAKYDGNCHIG